MESTEETRWPLCKMCETGTGVKMCPTSLSDGRDAKLVTVAQACFPSTFQAEAGELLTRSSQPEPPKVKGGWGEEERGSLEVE